MTALDARAMLEHAAEVIRAAAEVPAGRPFPPVAALADRVAVAEPTDSDEIVDAAAAAVALCAELLGANRMIAPTLAVADLLTAVAGYVDLLDRIAPPEALAHLDTADGCTCPGHRLVRAGVSVAATLNGDLP